MLVLVPWWVVHVHECVGVLQSAYYGVYVGMGQRRSHMVQLLVYSHHLVRKLRIQDWFMYCLQLVTYCHTLIDILLHRPTTPPETLELNP